MWGLSTESRTRLSFQTTQNLEQKKVPGYVSHENRDEIPAPIPHLVLCHMVKMKTSDKNWQSRSAFLGQWCLEMGIDWSDEIWILILTFFNTVDLNFCVGYGGGVERESSDVLWLTAGFLVTRPPENGNNRELYGLKWILWDQSVSQCPMPEKRREYSLPCGFMAESRGGLGTAFGDKLNWTPFSDLPLISLSLYVSIC